VSNCEIKEGDGEYPWYDKDTSNEYKKKTLSIVIQRKYAPIISNTKLKATL
jgi:hypothetical protein